MKFVAKNKKADASGVDKVIEVQSKFLKLVNGFWVVMHAFTDGVFVMIDRYKIIRRSSFVLSWYIVFWTIEKCFEAAQASNWNAPTIAALLAFLTPIAAIHGAGLKWYADSRGVEDKIEKG